MFVSTWNTKCRSMHSFVATYVVRWFALIHEEIEICIIAYYLCHRVHVSKCDDASICMRLSLQYHNNSTNFSMISALASADLKGSLKMHSLLLETLQEVSLFINLYDR